MARHIAARAFAPRETSSSRFRPQPNRFTRQVSVTPASAHTVRTAQRLRSSLTSGASAAVADHATVRSGSRPTSSRFTNVRPSWKPAPGPVIWEGDLLGVNQRLAIATQVELEARHTLLAPIRDGHSAKNVGDIIIDVCAGTSVDDTTCLIRT